MRRALAVGALGILLASCGGDSPSGPTAPPPPVATATPAPVPIWTNSGKGNTVFDMPARVTRVRIQGEWDRTNTSNFVVYVAGRLVVNEILRDSITYNGVHAIAGGGQTETRSSNQITWVFTEVR